MAANDPLSPSFTVKDLSRQGDNGWGGGRPRGGGFTPSMGQTSVGLGHSIRQNKLMILAADFVRLG